MRKRFIAIVKNQHKHVLKALIKEGKITAEAADKLDQRRVKATDACRSIQVDGE